MRFDEEYTVRKIMDSKNAVILDAYMKANSVLSGHSNVGVSVSGGADSDVMLDLIERARMGNGVHCDVTYVWFDTGLEYEATKRHIRYLEERYETGIVRRKAKKPIPSCVREYGQPFLSKYVSHQIESLQRGGVQMGRRADRHPPRQVFELQVCASLVVQRLFRRNQHV